LLENKIIVIDVNVITDIIEAIDEFYLKRNKYL